MYLLSDTSPARLLPDASAPAARGSASLTYEPFFGLREKPFSLSADPRFLYRSPAHGPAFDELQAGIRRREGLIVLTGEIGTGKTTLCRSVLQQLDRRTFAAFVADPFVSREDLLKTLLADFGVISLGDLTRGRFNGATRSDLSYPLYEFLDSLVPLQAFAVVVIDEAQNLSLPLLEEIRILSELERREKLLQVVLVGQPELRESLKLPQMRQVEQRVSVRCELTPLGADDVAGYVTHRLGIAASGESRIEFTRPALDAVHLGASGVPRLINRICDRALQRAYAARSLRIDARFVWEAVADLGLMPASGRIDIPAGETAAAPATVDVAVPVPVALIPASVPAPEPLPAAAPAPVLPSILRTSERAEARGLQDFTAEADLATGRAAAGGRAARSAAWTAGVLVAGLVVSSSAVGGFALHVRSRAASAAATIPLLPPSPASALPPPEPRPLDTEAAAAASVQSGTADAAAAPGRFAIVVASFGSRTRADRLVEELTGAGYRAQAVERDGGPERGRLLQVTVGGYLSAIDVQRDLQRIRELPGGYADARIIEP